MGCAASKLEEEEVVSICRERKRQLKLAVERRYALAEAHCKYCQSLYAVSAAISLFVARHASPSAPFLITFPSCPSPPSTDHNVTNNPMYLQQETTESNNPMYLQQRPSESNHETIACDLCDSSSTTSDSSCEEEETKEEVVREEHTHHHHGYFNYMQMPPPMPSPQRDFGWDFFNPFDGVRPEIISGYRRCSDDELRVVREEEGIPELEEEGENREEAEQNVVRVEENGHKEVGENEVGVVKVDDGDSIMDKGEQKGLTVIDTPEKGRELLEALKDIEDHFIRAHDSGKDVSRMLEVNRVHLQSHLEEIKENSAKLMRIKWHRSTSSRSSSCKSLVASSSKNSLALTEFKNDLFDEYGGMDSGSHSSTLERLYAWEKKLYEEVKAGDSTRKIYEKKCSRLRNQDVRGDDELTVDKTRVAVKDLYARILVAIRTAESISKRIEKLRDEELQPQVVELLKGLTKNWKIMLESHETQNKILNEIKTFACSTYGKFSNNTHQRATLQLEVEIDNWRVCFTEYVTAQKAYVEALHSWLTKFIVPEVEFYSRGKRSSMPCQVNGPPLLVICHDWLGSMEKLPYKAVAYALKSFSKDVKALRDQQGKEQDQKRKVDGLAKELDRRISAYQKTETRFLESKLTEVKSELEVDNHNAYLTEKKDQMDTFRRKLEAEREKHHNYMQETQRITLNGFQTGFSTVFESLVEFSKVALNMYNDLLSYSENPEKAGKESFIESSEVEENGTK